MLCSHMIMLYTVKVTDDFELQVLQNIEGFLNVIPESYSVLVTDSSSYSGVAQ